MVSLERWKEHLRHMAQKGHRNEDDIFIVNQNGHGLGRNAFPKCSTFSEKGDQLENRDLNFIF